MVEFCIDNMDVEFGGHVYQQTVGIPLSANCAPLVQMCSYVHMKPIHMNTYKRLRPRNKQKSLNLIYRYKDDVILLNNLKFNDHIDVVHPKELEIKVTTDSPKWASIFK